MTPLEPQKPPEIPSTNLQKTSSETSLKTPLETPLEPLPETSQEKLSSKNS